MSEGIWKVLAYPVKMLEMRVMTIKMACVYAVCNSGL